MPRELHPLRTVRSGSSSSAEEEERDPQSPEALLISALLEIGDFAPARYHVSDDMVMAWRRVWDFCRAYQAQADVAPPLSLIKTRFPDFEVVPDVSPSWAAHQLMEADGHRRLRIGMREALSQLADGDVSAAYGLLTSMKPPHTMAKPALDVFDHALTEAAFERSSIEVPWKSLQSITDGIFDGELWYWAARFGVGKTWCLMDIAAHGAAQGYKIGVISLEMPAPVIVKRLHLMMCKHDKVIHALLTSMDVHDQKAGIDMLRDRIPGEVSILDPSHGQVHRVEYVRDALEEYDLVMVDHMGLLHDTQGRRAIDDWRVQAICSNMVREYTLSSGTALVAAVQINREGDRHGQWTPPKGNQLAGSDALGQDADVLVTMARPSVSTAVYSSEKVRNGPTARWYSYFDPATPRWQEISKDRAMDAAMTDEDVKAYVE